MSASRVACTVVWSIVRQRQLHASPPANELSWLLKPKFLATPEICSSQSRVEYISQGNPGSWIKHNRGNAKLQRPIYGSSSVTDIVFKLCIWSIANSFLISYIIKDYYCTCNPTSRHGTSYIYTWPRPTVKHVWWRYSYCDKLHRC